MGLTKLKGEKYNEFWKNWSSRRISKKIVGKHLFSEKGDYFNSFKIMKYTKAKIIDSVTPVAVDIFGKDKVLILNYEEPASCILIHDKNTATSFINFFYQLWNQAKA